MRDLLKQEKTEAALAQIRAIRAESDERAKIINMRNNPPVAPVPAPVYRQVRKPVFNKEGEIILDASGQPLFETISEPVFPGQPSNNGQLDIVSMLGLFKSMGNDNKNQSNPSIDALMTELRTQNANRALEEKNSEIKRLQDKMDAAEQDHKREKERVEEKLQDKLDRITADNAKNLESLKERFLESIQHQKDIDSIAGSLSERHKKEMDEIKKQLQHSQSSIEKTIVAKAAETSSNVVDKMTDMAKSVVEPMSGVLRDHYATVIDQQRKTAGLPSLANSIPTVSEDDLKKFVEAQ